MQHPVQRYKARPWYCSRRSSEQHAVQLHGALVLLLEVSGAMTDVVSRGNHSKPDWKSLRTPLIGFGSIYIDLGFSLALNGQL